MAFIKKLIDDKKFEHNQIQLARIKMEKLEELKLLTLIGDCVRKTDDKYYFKLFNGKDYEFSKEINLNNKINNEKYREIKTALYSKEWLLTLCDPILAHKEGLKFLKQEMKKTRNFKEMFDIYFSRVIAHSSEETKNKILDRLEYNLDKQKIFDGFDLNVEAFKEKTKTRAGYIYGILSSLF